MRYLKYIESGFSIIMAIILALYVYQVDAPKISIIALIITLDLVTKISVKRYAKQLQEKGSIVLISQKDSDKEKITSLFFLLFTIVFVIVLVVEKKINTTTISEHLGSFLPLYIVFNSLLFNNYDGKFYVSKYGFIQPELFSKNYAWEEIKKLELRENVMSFTLKNKDYVIPIPKEKIIRLKQLTEQWQYIDNQL